MPVDMFCNFYDDIAVNRPALCDMKSGFWRKPAIPTKLVGDSVRIGEVSFAEGLRPSAHNSLS